MMMLSLDNLAHRYGMLPSEALARATTLDLHILDVGAKWSNHQAELAQSGNSLVKTPKRPKLSQEQMMNMIKSARGEL
jgi:hypothetical protein